MVKDNLISLIEEDNDLQCRIDSIEEVTEGMSLDFLLMDESAEEKIDRVFPSGLTESYQLRVERE